MATYEIGETVICSIEIKDAGALTDPATSMNIVIDLIKPNFTNIITSTAMTKDSTGKYHYDLDSAGSDRGTYQATYTATDGTRITIEKEGFELE